MSIILCVFPATGIEKTAQKVTSGAIWYNRLWQATGIYLRSLTDRYVAFNKYVDFRFKALLLGC